jgi:hypothetical protein
MTKIYVLDVDDFRPLAEVVVSHREVTVRRRGPYFEVASSGPIHIDRNATGCRNAVWYSSIAGISDGVISIWDKNELLIEPISAAAPLAGAPGHSRATDWSPVVPPGP